MLMPKTIANQNFRAFNEAVQDQKYSFRTISEIKKEIKSLDKLIALKWGKSLIKGNPIQAAIGGVLLSSGNAWEMEQDFLIKHIDILASSNNWQKREIAIELLKQSLMYSKKHFIPLLVKLISSKNNFRRRTAITVAKKIALLKPKYILLKLDVLNVLAPFLHENSPFVSRAVIDTFANGFIKYCPAEFFRWIEELIPTITKNTHKILLLRMLSTQILYENLHDVLDIIMKFIHENDILVSCARLSTLKSLAKDYPKQIGAWLDRNLHIEAVVDHWAKLDLAGLIPSFC